MCVHYIVQYITLYSNYYVQVSIEAHESMNELLCQLVAMESAVTEFEVLVIL